MPKEKLTKILWTGPPQHSSQAGMLQPGQVYEVAEAIAEPWLRDGWAENVAEAAPKKASKKE